MSKFPIVFMGLGLMGPMPATHFVTDVIAVAEKSSALGMEQQVKIADLVTKQSTPLFDVKFPVAVDTVVPPDVPIQPLPKEADTIAPELHGFGYVVVEEQIALVDQKTRKIGYVIQRARAQGKG